MNHDTVLDVGAPPDFGLREVAADDDAEEQRCFLVYENVAAQDDVASDPRRLGNGRT